MALEKSEQKGVVILCMTTMMLLFSYKKDVENSEFMECLNQMSSGHSHVRRTIEQCVPHHELLEEQMKRQTGKAALNRTAMSLLAAYNYGRYAIVTVEAQGWYGREVYCRYLDANLRETEPAIRTVVFPEFIVYCCGLERAAHMSITQTVDEAVVLTAPVMQNQERHYKYDVSLCLAPIYGKNSVWLLLAEMIEYYKLQGIEHFFLYVKDMEAYSKRDCLYKNRNFSRFLLFGDLDERLTPVGNITVAEFISRAMVENPRCGALSFEPRWVIRSSEPPVVYQGEDTLRKHLPMIVFQNTSTPPLVRGDTAKYALDPNKVILAWVHDVKIFVPYFESCNVTSQSAYIR
ncbi:hypothetical protein ANCCEY_09106 [Ancylostoma ceylanicum]|uniref:Glycosyltransferase family 92 protein n=1 Tax=Ancylostoma ceylanicum TaxID=53326 RepID=A0A0D6LW03_9BILA|nr:hypothetical protein ANCCEY_09106 [Ancylostoma ceylanicum]